jgi:hypothetical protein
VEAVYTVRFSASPKFIATLNMTAKILFLTATSLGMAVGQAEFMHPIVIDGDFSDWAAVPSHLDPAGGPGVLDQGIPDTHDTDHSAAADLPAYVNHPDIDLIEYRFTHDRSNVYAYFRAAGVIGRTINTSTRHGRYYVIVTLDVDDRLDTGYFLHEGGYYPTSGGYDMNMEVEYYDGAFNTGHYLNHGATNQTQLDAAGRDQTNGIVRILPGTYDYYTQWVWFDNPTTGTNRLPPPDDSASITFVRDRGPVYQGIIRIALSSDGHEAEMVAPFRGFMRDPEGQPIMAMGRVLNLSFSLEASGELAPDQSWASDTGRPIRGYRLSPYPEPNLRIATVIGSEGEVGLIWDQEAQGLVLQQSTSLDAPDWKTINESSLTNRVKVVVGTTCAFFRLVEPETL